MMSQPPSSPGQQQHIRNVYVSLARRTPYLSERILVIETDLTLPQSRFEARDSRLEDLLIELHEMKESNPALFCAVDAVEIRGPENHMNIVEEETNIYDFLPGRRAPSPYAVEVPVV